MLKTYSHKFICLLYDGIENAVFNSQVLQPLIKKREQNSALDITIISFERKRPAQKTIEQIKCYGIAINIYYRLPFLGIISLKPAIWRLKKVLKNYASYEILARGPQAGFIARMAASKNCTNLTIQVRGLLAQEFDYAFGPKQAMSWLHRWRLQELQKLEAFVYGFVQCAVPLTFQAVSIALREHLIKRYQTTAALITIARDDIAQPLATQTRVAWRNTIRAMLGLSERTTIYCYNGSIKPWQCPDQVIAYFAQQLTKQENIFLLILSHHKTAFQTLLKKHAIDASRYFVCTIEHESVMHYLCAADYGIIFRKPHIINWVARPTKVLEYQAVGLPIIHNNTIALLADNPDPHHQPVISTYYSSLASSDMQKNRFNQLQKQQSPLAQTTKKLYS